MTRLSHTLFVAATLVVPVGPAFADDPALPTGAAMEGEPPPPPPPVVKKGNPQAIIERPRTTPGGQITVGGDLFVIMESETILTTTTDTQKLGIGLSGVYGINDKIQVGASYGLVLTDFEDSTDFTPRGNALVHGGYAVLDDGKLSMAAGGGLALDLTAIDSSGDETLEATLVAGATVQYKVSPKIAVFTGNPVTYGSVGQQLSIGLFEKGPIAIHLPVGAGMQVTPSLYAFMGTQLGSLYFANGPLDPDSMTGETKSFELFGLDQIPINLGAFFSPSNTMDFGASVGFLDLKDFDRTISVFGSARLHL